MFVSPENLKVLTCNVIIFRNEALGGHKGVAPMLGLDTRWLASSLSGHVRTQRRQPSASQEDRPPEKPNLPRPQARISSLQNREKIILCCLSHPDCGILLWQLLEINRADFLVHQLSNIFQALTSPLCHHSCLAEVKPSASSTPDVKYAVETY